MDMSLLETVCDGAVLLEQPPQELSCFGDLLLRGSGRSVHIEGAGFEFEAKVFQVVLPRKSLDRTVNVWPFREFAKALFEPPLEQGERETAPFGQHPVVHEHLPQVCCGGGGGGVAVERPMGQCYLTPSNQRE